MQVVLYGCLEIFTKKRMDFDLHTHDVCLVSDIKFDEKFMSFPQHRTQSNGNTVVCSFQFCGCVYTCALVTAGGQDGYGHGWEGTTCK